MGALLRRQQRKGWFFEKLEETVLEDGKTNGEEREKRGRKEKTMSGVIAGVGPFIAERLREPGKSCVVWFGGDFKPGK